MEPQQPMSPAPAPVQPDGPDMNVVTPPQQPMQDASQPMMQPQPLSATVVGENPGKGMAVAGLVFAFLAPLIGLILSIIAKGKSKKAGHKNGVALAGIIVSVIAMLTWTIVVVVLVLAAVGLNAKCADLGPGTHLEGGVTYTCPE